jgi:hypothetical protein
MSYFEEDRHFQAEQRAISLACARAHKAFWRVVQRNGNASAFNGYHWTLSDYSGVRCTHPDCGRFWRTKANYVRDLPDITPEESTR